MGKVVIMKPTKIEKIEDSIHQVYGSNRKDQCENMMIEDPIILIGTDGSGTRVPTRALSKMGITILVDPEVSHQMDIDGSAVGVHFTKLIRDLLCITGGPNYQLEDLPQDFREHLLSILRPWVDFVRGQACAAAKRRKNLNTFRFGFKKPDLMFLIPVLRYFWKDVKFVHILRDGRDMALSRNDATHEKYGAAMFGQGCDRSIQEDEMSFEDFMKLPKEARMALLWSRSNVGVEKMFSSSDFEDSRQLIRVEDMNAQDDRSVNTYTNLAKFANLNTLGVCMICEIRSQIQSTFMGSFDASLEEKKGKTKNAALLNYGKWKRLSSSDPDLLSTIELAAHAKANKSKAYRKRMSRTQSVYLFLKNSAQRAAENRNCIGKWVGGGMCCIGTIIALSVLIIGIIAAAMVVAVPDMITGCYCNKMEGLTAPEIPQAFKTDTSCPLNYGYNVTHVWTESTLDEGELCKGCSSHPYVRTGYDNSQCWDGDPENEHVRQMIRFTGTYRRLLCKFWSDVLNRDEALCGLER
eukprot:g4649.t1